MTRPTDTLRAEHALILRALDALAGAADGLERGAGLPDGWWDDLITWLRAFADRNHHGKEERALFPAMARAGVPAGAGGPLGVMLDEHKEGRLLIQGMEATDPAARAGAARAYIALLRAHIDKENDVLFPVADAVIDEAAQRSLTDEFEALAEEVGRDGALDHAEAVLEGLTASLEASA